MKNNFTAPVTIISGWVLICVSISLVVTGLAHPETTSVFSAVLFFSPALLRIITLLLSHLRPEACMTSRYRRRISIHLNPWQPTGNLNREKVRWFWLGVEEMLQTTLSRQQKTVIMGSHLLSKSRLNRLAAGLPEEQYHVRVSINRLNSAAKFILQLDVLCREWRWFHPRETWPVLVVRKRNTPFSPNSTGSDRAMKLLNSKK